MPIRRRTIPSPVGQLAAAASDRGVCLLEFNPRRTNRGLTELALLARDKATDLAERHLDELEPELDGYFAGRLTEFTVPLDTPGTPWQRRVWEALLAIPFGQSRTYGELAGELGNPGAARAVGLANGRNRISIIVPCHRVIATGGTLGGYGGGLRRKRWLLVHEASHARTEQLLFQP